MDERKKQLKKLISMMTAVELAMWVYSIVDSDELTEFAISKLSEYEIKLEISKFK